MKYVRAFFRFWWDFIVGDDWPLALGVALAIAATWLLAHHGVDAWWLLPPAIVILTSASLWRAVRSSGRA